MKGLIEFLYSVFIGIAVALFVGFGVWAFQPGPQMPEHPETRFSPSGELTEDDKTKQSEYQQAFEKYDQETKAYSRRVSIIVLVPAILFFLAGLRLMKNNSVVSEGLAVGGVFTSVYALIRAGHSEHRIIVFSVATVLLVMVILLAQTKFRPGTPKSAK